MTDSTRKIVEFGAQNGSTSSSLRALAGIRICIHKYKSRTQNFVPWGVLWSLFRSGRKSVEINLP